MYIYVCTCICTCVGVHVCVGMLGWVLSVHLYLFVCSVACYSILDPFGEIRTSCRRSEPDSDSCSLWTRCMVIRRPIHGMIRRPVPVRAVKTRRRFGSKTSSFHVSVRSCVFTVIGMCFHINVIISCDFLLYFTCLITSTTS